MPQLSLSRTLLALAILVAAPSSQVPPGDAALFRDLFSSNDPLQVLAVGTGQVSSVTVSPAPQSTGSGAIDPATGLLFSASLLDYHAWSYELDGLGSATASVFGELPVPGALTSVALDRNGDLYGLANDGQLFRFERSSGDATLLADLPVHDTAWIEIDPEGHRMWMVTHQIATDFYLYELDLADPAREPTLLLQMPSGILGGLAYDASRDVLYLCTATSNSQLMRYDLEEAQLVFYAQDTLPVGPAFSLDYDRSRDLVHLLGGEFGAPAKYYTFDPRTLDLELVSEDAGAGYALIRVNDFLDSTTVFPLRPQAGVGFTLEVAAHGEVGEFAAVFAVSINGSPISPLLLATGTCDAGGISGASHSIGPDVLSAGDTVGFVAARLSEDTGSVVIAPLATLETLP